MLRVLTLTTLFPDALRPTFGIFVERQTLELARHATGQVVAGIGLPPWPLSLHPHYRGRRSALEAETWKGLDVRRPRFRSVPRLPAFSARALAAAALPLARAFRPDVIDSEFFWPDGVAAMHLGRALGVPFSVKARGSDIHFWGNHPAVRRQMLEAAQEAAGLVAVSAALKGSMAQLGMPEAKIVVQYTGVDQARFKPIDRSEAKAALGVEGPLLVSAGALIPLKGQGLVIDALERIPGATLILAGDGPERRRLEAMAPPGRVRFLGNRPHEELPGLLGAADVMVLPSEREGLANVWVEALACGTPLVITDVGGAREVMDRREAGRLVERNPAAIAEGVNEILASPPPQEAVRRAAERFSWDSNARTLVSHLERIAGPSLAGG
jgi:glycosyltransferase involved in cell wall biosynthesis